MAVSPGESLYLDITYTLGPDAQRTPASISARVHSRYTMCRLLLNITTLTLTGELLTGRNAAPGFPGIFIFGRGKSSHAKRVGGLG